MKHVTAHWSTCILVCKKCSKKAGGGFGEKGRTSLAKALRARGSGKRGRKADFGVIETGCLKLCPKNAVVVIDTAYPQDWRVVPRGTDVDALAGDLGI